MTRASLWIAAFACALACAVEPVEPETPAPTPDVHPAVGSLAGLPPEVARAFVDDPLAFLPLRPTQPGDWLEDHREPGQTVAQFLAGDPLAPTSERHTIYIQPFGPLPSQGSSWPSLDELAAHVERFFGLEVALLEPITVEALAAAGVEIGAREGDFGRQLDTDDVLDALHARLPDDAFLLVGLTLEDLYPGDDWNYVFGFASFTRRVCVYSLLRLDPQIAEPRRALDPAERVERTRARSVAVLSHELTHSFGVRHCVHHDCVMNGTNSLAELDRHPLHLCPVCLRKLHLVLGFDPRARYEALAHGYAELGLDDAAGWARLRAASLGER